MNLLLSPHLGGGRSLLLTQLQPGRDVKREVFRYQVVAKPSLGKCTPMGTGGNSTQSVICRWR